MKKGIIALTLICMLCISLVPASAETVPNDQSQYIPSYGSPYPPMENENSSYWTTPMDITDTETVWKMLMEPITVLDINKKDQLKSQVVLRAEPRDDAAGVGVVTCLSQGVRILERQSEWTRIECYSSSFFDSAVKAWDMLVQGWVPTKYLKLQEPDQHIAFVVDKLEQLMYIFVDGEIYDTLLVSTGHANEKQPYNETRSGEYLLQLPAVGGYVDDGMHVAMAIRFNSGDLMHQVPYKVDSDGKKSFGTYESRLGTKASHGCIRVQRRKTPLGTNMEWIWSNKKKNMKLIIWEDLQGRQLSYPDDETQLYYNPDGGRLYHSSSFCYSASKITFVPFSYGELDSGDYARLDRCTYCHPPLRKAEIDVINANYAPGGDHDPILSQAQQKYLDSVNNTN